MADIMHPRRERLYLGGTVLVLRLEGSIGGDADLNVCALCVVLYDSAVTDLAGFCHLLRES